MNREILFRGKRVDNGEWAEGSLCVFDTEMHFIRPIGHSFRFQWEKVIPETVGQFTGLMDKEKNNIFEGDLIEVCDNKNGLLKVEFVNAYSGGWVLSHESTHQYLSLGARKPDEIKITGNIHENK